MDHTITVADGVVHYTPPVGFEGTIEFTYAIRDEKSREASASVSVEVSNEFGLSLCDDYPGILVEVAALHENLGIATEDLDNDGIPDDFMLEAMQVVACYEGVLPLGTALDTAYKVNLLLFDDEANADPLSPYREAIAALMAMSTFMQNALANELGVAGLPVAQQYEAVWCDSEGLCMPQPIPETPLEDGFEVFDETRESASLQQPFSAQGDLDGDALSNLEELQEILAGGGGSTEFAIAATDAALNVGGVGGGGGGCFIATAALGTPLAGEIDVLRGVRDTVLLPGALGTMIVDVYYRLSPAIAEQVAERPMVASTIRVMLRPAIRLSESLVTSQSGHDRITALLFLLLLGCVAVGKSRSRRTTS
jgi:hypothetical protein